MRNARASSVVLFFLQWFKNFVYFHSSVNFRTMHIFMIRSILVSIYISYKSTISWKKKMYLYKNFTTECRISYILIKLFYTNYHIVVQSLRWMEISYVLLCYSSRFQDAVKNCFDFELVLVRNKYIWMQ